MMMSPEEKEDPRCAAAILAGRGISWGNEYRARTLLLEVATRQRAVAQAAVASVRALERDGVEGGDDSVYGGPYARLLWYGFMRERLDVIGCVEEWLQFQIKCLAGGGGFTAEGGEDPYLEQRRALLG